MELNKKFQFKTLLKNYQIKNTQFDFSSKLQHSKCLLKLQKERQFLHIQCLFPFNLHLNQKSYYVGRLILVELKHS